MSADPTDPVPAPIPIEAAEREVLAWLRAHDLDAGVRWAPGPDRLGLPRSFGHGAAATLVAGDPLRRFVNLQIEGRAANPAYRAFVAMLRGLGYYHAPDRVGGVHLFPLAAGATGAAARDCAACGLAHAGDLRYCQRCGAGQPPPGRSALRACPRCGGEVADHHTFCRHCGAAQADAGPAVGAAPNDEAPPWAEPRPAAPPVPGLVAYLRGSR